MKRAPATKFINDHKYMLAGQMGHCNELSLTGTASRIIEDSVSSELNRGVFILCFAMRWKPRRIAYDEMMRATMQRPVCRGSGSAGAVVSLYADPASAAHIGWIDRIVAIQRLMNGIFGKLLDSEVLKALLQKSNIYIRDDSGIKGGKL